MNSVSTEVLYVPFVEKYRPKTKKELIGNKAAIDRIDRFLSEWKPDKKPKGLLLVGPPGIGKTTAVYALANDHNMDVVEFNASDNRNKKDLLEFVQPLTEYTNLFSERMKVILIDEVDGLSGQKDRGAVPTLNKLLQSTRYPIILCANDIEDNKVQSLAKNVPLVQFSRPDEFTIFELLEKIAEKEKIKISEDELQIIAEAAAGDIRAALNELESFKFGTGKTYLPPSRDKMKTWVDYFNGIFFAKTAVEARASTQNPPTSDYRMILNYLFDLAHRYCSTPEELARTYGVLAAADLVLARISRTLDWSLLRYFFQLIGPGLFWARTSHGGKRLSSVTNLPLAFFAIGRGKQVNKLAIELAEQVHHKLHIGKKEFVHNEFPYFMRLMHGETGAKIVAWLDLDDTIVEKIVKYTKDKSLLKYLEDARAEIGRVRIKDAANVQNDTPDNAVEELLKSRIFEAIPEKKKGRKRSSKSKKEKKQEQNPSEPPPQEKSPTTEEKAKDKNQFSLDDFF
ncbi:MAG: replication factor C large subunit [Methanobacteriota archaeon]|nr:MAG: replication factor C large subunit [Euryarchaeota archaeon]